MTREGGGAGGEGFSKVVSYWGQSLLVTAMTLIHQTCPGSSAVCQALGWALGTPSVTHTDQSPCSPEGEKTAATPLSETFCFLGGNEHYGERSRGTRIGRGRWRQPWPKGVRGQGHRMEGSPGWGRAVQRPRGRGSELRGGVLLEQRVGEERAGVQEDE